METPYINSIKSTGKNWWAFLLLGIFQIVFGVWIFQTPIQSYLALAIFFSVSMLVSGIAEVFFAIANRKEYDGWGWHLAGGALDLILGGFLMMNPTISMSVLSLYVGFWLMFRGIMAIGVSLQLGSFKLKNWGWLLLGGLSIVFFSFMVLANPFLGGLSIVAFTSLAFITAGIYNVYFSFKVRKFRKVVNKRVDSLIKIKYESPSEMEEKVEDVSK